MHKAGPRLNPGQVSVTTARIGVAGSTVVCFKYPLPVMLFTPEMTNNKSRCHFTFIYCCFILVVVFVVFVHCYNCIIVHQAREEGAADLKLLRGAIHRSVCIDRLRSPFTPDTAFVNLLPRSDSNGHPPTPPNERCFTVSLTRPSVISSPLLSFPTPLLP